MFNQFSCSVHVCVLFVLSEVKFLVKDAAVSPNISNPQVMVMWSGQRQYFFKFVIV